MGEREEFTINHSKTGSKDRNKGNSARQDRHRLVFVPEGGPVRWASSDRQGFGEGFGPENQGDVFDEGLNVAGRGDGLGTQLGELAQEARVGRDVDVGWDFGGHYCGQEQLMKLLSLWGSGM